MFSFPTSDFDLDRIEWYMSRRDMAFAPFWQEQTSWAILAAARSVHYFAPSAFFVPSGPPGPDAGVPAALHFVNPIRSHLPAWRDVSSDQPLQVTTQRAHRLSFVTLALEECARLARRWLRG
jgi:hypothetical protein